MAHSASVEVEVMFGKNFLTLLNGFIIMPFLFWYFPNRWLGGWKVGFVSVWVVTLIENNIQQTRLQLQLKLKLSLAIIANSYKVIKGRFQKKIIGKFQ